jgi:hypothetical protein
VKNSKSIKNINTSCHIFNIPTLNYSISSDHKANHLDEIFKYFKYQSKGEYKGRYLEYKNIKDKSSIKYFKYQNIQ